MKTRFLDTIQRAYAKSLKLDYQLDDLKFIIFSDHHRGMGDSADDFRFASGTYESALNYYQLSGHGLILLGDVDELWECTPEEVLAYYAELTRKEMEFRECYRIWGNHDSDWSRQKMVEKYLKSVSRAYESITIQVNDNGKMLGKFFLVHGHQGTLFSDEFARLSKFFVRYFWRPFQKFTDQPLTTAANSTAMRSRHDRRYYAWANEHNQDLIVITGHTHEPVFNSFTYADRLRLASARLSQAMLDSELTLEQRVRYDEVQDRMATITSHASTSLNPDGNAVPCYFNTGCCSFGDGGITGIEIADGEIRLVKWDAPGERRVIQHAGLRRIFKLLELNATVENDGI